jgi:hypothetical protein
MTDKMRLTSTTARVSSGRRTFSLLVTIAIALLLSSPVWSQGTGGSFPTPGGQNVPGVMMLVPSGPITSGQPVAAPPSSVNGLPVLCTNCSPSAPIGASSNPVNGTIGSTNTFQTLITLNANRRGCSFQNQGTHNMYFSVASSPALANSLIVPPNGIFYCSQSNIVVTDTINVTGTSPDAFAGQWQ